MPESPSARPQACPGFEQVTGNSTPTRAACKIGLLLLGLTFLLAVAVRFYGLGTQDYWFDELYSLSFSAGKKAEFASLPYGQIIREFDLTTDIDASTSIATIVSSMRSVDTHPPVYFILLWGWRSLVGESEFAVRSLSAGFSVLTVVALWGILAAMGRPRAGLIAASIGALTYSEVFIGQQNRHYSLSMLLACLCVLLFVLGEKHWTTSNGSPMGRRGILLAVAFGVSAYLAVLTHYFSGLALIGLAIYAFARLRGRALAIWFTASAVAALAAAATWGPSLLDQTKVIEAQRWLIDPLSNHKEVTLLRFLDLPVRLLMWTDITKPNWPQALAGLSLAVAAGIVLIRNREKQAFLFACLYLVPALFLFLIDFPSDKQTLFPLRYVAIAVPGLIGLLALAIDSLWRSSDPGRFDSLSGRSVATERAPVGQGGRLSALIGLGALLVTMAVRLPLPAIDHANAREAVELLRERIRPADLIVYDAIGWPKDWVPQFFAPMAYYGRDIKNPVLLLRDPISDELREKIAEFTRVFVVSPRIDDASGKPIVPNPTPQTHELAGRSAYVHQVGWIYFFERNNPSVN